MSPLALALQSLLWSWNFVLKTPARRRAVLAPVFINFVLWLVIVPSAFLVRRLVGVLLPDALWATALSILAGILAVALFLVLAVFLFTTLTAVIGAPFYSFLAEEAFRESGGSPLTRPWWKDLLHAVSYTLKLALLFLFVQAVLLLLNLLPGVGTVLHAVGAFAVALLFLAMEFLGEAFSLRGLSFGSRLSFLVRHHDSVLAFAVIVFFLLLVPGLNLVVPALAVVAGSRIAMPNIQRSNDKYPRNEQ